MKIEHNLQTVQRKIAQSAKSFSRDPDSIKLVGVSKTIELKKVIEAVHAGVTILGENRIQEAQKKITEFRAHPPPLNKGGATVGVEWHLIGNLQKNKAKAAVQLFDLIHSVDSLALAEELNKHARRQGKRQRILVQVKLSDETTKHGVSENKLNELLDTILQMDSVLLEGLMTIPPYFESIEKTRPYFRKLRGISESALAQGYPVKELSMGMSNDFTIAIEEGSTMVRVGTAIFGERKYAL